jgi:uncharacterized membrane protein
MGDFCWIVGSIIYANSNQNRIYFRMKEGIDWRENLGILSL